MLTGITSVPSPGITQCLPSLASRLFASCLGIGGAYLGKDVDEKLAIQFVRTAIHGTFELFKTPSMFDSTAEHPGWLGEERKQLQAMISE